MPEVAKIPNMRYPKIYPASVNYNLIVLEGK